MTGILVVGAWKRYEVQISNDDEVRRLDTLHAEQFNGAPKAFGDAVDSGKVDGVQVEGATWIPQGSIQCAMLRLDPRGDTVSSPR